MTYKYPREFLNIPKDKIMFCEPPKPLLKDCDNCGGLAIMYAFMIDRGPYIHVPPHGRGEVIKSKFDQQYGWLWFIGNTKGLPCPVCGGVGREQKIVKQEEPKQADYKDHTI